MYSNTLSVIVIKCIFFLAKIFLWEGLLDILYTFLNIPWNALPDPEFLPLVDPRTAVGNFACKIHIKEPILPEIEI